ncbi:MAG: hypothetical protein ACOCV1_04105 [Bacillota bacterium]
MEVTISAMLIVILLFLFVIITENLLNWGFRETADDEIVLLIVILWIVRTGLVIGILSEILI